MILPEQQPDRDSVADFDTALRRKREPSKQLLASVRDKVIAAYEIYNDVGGSLPIKDAMPAEKDALEALRSNYELTYSGGSLFELRADVMFTAVKDLCPMCGIGKVSTVDHYLPKELFPEFSIYSLNLIPACSDCNFKKRNFVGTESEGRFVHAYYDTLPSSTSLLNARVHTGTEEVRVDFSVNENLPSEIYRNVAVQFEVLKLNDLYSWAGEREVTDHIDTFTEALKSGGSELVAKTIRKRCRTYRRNYGDHYWKVALYEGLESSVEFCAGAFRALAHIEP